MEQTPQRLRSLGEASLQLDHLQAQADAQSLVLKALVQTFGGHEARFRAAAVDALAALAPGAHRDLVEDHFNHLLHE